MYSLRCALIHIFTRTSLLLLLLTALPCVSGIIEINFNGVESNSSNLLNPVIKLNSSDVITDNSIHVLEEDNPTTPHEKVGTKLTTSSSGNFKQLFNNSEVTLTKTSSEPTTPVFTNYSTSNLTTIAPPEYHKNSKSHIYKILLYTLIPVSAILTFLGIFFMVRRIQRIKRKRRLERELIHQYSYPNSEVGDLDDEQRILEVESVINTQFHQVNDTEEKNFVAEIPQVTVNIGEGSKLVLEEESPLMDNMEVSTSFNC